MSDLICTDIILEITSQGKMSWLTCNVKLIQNLSAKCMPTSLRTVILATELPNTVIPT